MLAVSAFMISLLEFFLLGEILVLGCGVRVVVQHQLILALRQQTARELRRHGAARLLLPALRRLAANLIPVQLVDRSLKGLTLEELILATSLALDTRLSVIPLSSS